MAGLGEQPRAPDDPRLLAGHRLGAELRAAVRREGVRAVRLDVRLALPAVEDVVARERHERETECGDIRRPADVHGSSALGIVLGTVDVGPRGRMEDEVERWQLGRRERHVPVGVGECQQFVAGERLLQRTAELPAGPRYENAASEQAALSRGERVGVWLLHRCLTRGSAQQSPCSSGSAGSYSSVTW